MFSGLRGALRDLVSALELFEPLGLLGICVTSVIWLIRVVKVSWVVRIFRVITATKVIRVVGVIRVSFK